MACRYLFVYQPNLEKNWKKKSVKTTAIRLIAVQETGVSRHQGGPIEGPPEIPRTSQHYRIELLTWPKGKGSTVFPLHAAVPHSPAQWPRQARPTLSMGLLSAER